MFIYKEVGGERIHGPFTRYTLKANIDLILSNIIFTVYNDRYITLITLR